MPVTHAQIIELRRKIAEKHKAADDLLGDDPSRLDAETLKKVETIHADMDRDAQQVEAWEKELDEDLSARELEVKKRDALDRQSRYADLLKGSGGPKTLDADVPPASSDAAHHHEAFRALLKFGEAGLNERELTLVRGHAFDISALRKTDPNLAAEISSFSDVSLGYLLPAERGAALESAQKFIGGMLTADLHTWTSSTAAPFPLPTDDDTDQEGEYIEENESHEGGALPKTAVKFLTGYTCSSRVIKIPMQYRRDMTGEEIEKWIFERADGRIARRKNRGLTLGTGVGSPRGIVPDSVLGHTTGAPFTLTYEDWIALEHSVDPAYRTMPSAQYMFHDTVLQASRQIKSGDGVPLWRPGAMEVGAPSTIGGKPYNINQHMAPLGAGNIIATFGPMKKYYHRKVGKPVMLILKERYAERLQIGVLVFEVHDGRLVDAGTHPIKHMKSAAA